jgi:hypothetical protein
MASEQAGIWVTTEVEVSESVVETGARSGDDIGGGFGTSAVQQIRKSLTQRVRIGADDLKHQVGELLRVVADVFDQSRREEGLQLEEVALSVEVTSAGQVSILGTGGKIGGSGGIKLTFKRRPAPP